MKLLRVAAIIICFAGLMSLSAQNKPKKDDKSKLPIDRPVAVKANVKVLDANGNYINDLKTANIRVFEDGVEQKITYFVKKEPILNLALVMDNTGSMRTQLEKIIPAGISLVDTLTDKDEAFVVRFISSDKIETVQEWTSNKFKLKEGLENMFVEGGHSAVIDALYLAAEKMQEREKKDKTTRCAIVLVSDAEERASYYGLPEMLSLFKDTDMEIFVVGIMSELPKNRTDVSQPKRPREFSEGLAHTLALETGGSAYILDAKYKNDDLLGAVKMIAEELRYQYVIGYTSTNAKRDGVTRKLRVEISDGEKGEKRRGFIRESFVVPKEPL